MEEIDEAREERDRSEIIDSGLEREDAALVTEGRREAGGQLSLFRLPIGKVSMAHRLMPARCAIAITGPIDIDDRREPQALTAGVLEATDDGVHCGVGNGPMRANAGVGGARSGFGSKNRGNTVSAVGVLSCDVESICITLSALLGGVGVVGDGAKP